MSRFRPSEMRVRQSTEEDWFCCSWRPDVSWPIRLSSLINSPIASISFRHHVLQHALQHLEPVLFPQQALVRLLLAQLAQQQRRAPPHVPHPQSHLLQQGGHPSARLPRLGRLLLRDKADEGAAVAEDYFVVRDVEQGEGSFDGDRLTFGDHSDQDADGVRSEARGDVAFVEEPDEEGVVAQKLGEGAQPGEGQEGQLQRLGQSRLLEQVFALGVLVEQGVGQDRLAQLGDHRLVSAQQQVAPHSQHPLHVLVVFLRYGSRRSSGHQHLAEAVAREELPASGLRQQVGQRTIAAFAEVHEPRALGLVLQPNGEGLKEEGSFGAEQFFEGTVAVEQVAQQGYVARDNFRTGLEAGQCGRQTPLDERESGGRAHEQRPRLVGQGGLDEDLDLLLGEIELSRVEALLQTLQEAVRALLDELLLGHSRALHQRADEQAHRTPFPEQAEQLLHRADADEPLLEPAVGLEDPEQDALHLRSQLLHLHRLPQVLQFVLGQPLRPRLDLGLTLGQQLLLGQLSDDGLLFALSALGLLLAFGLLLLLAPLLALLVALPLNQLSIAFLVLRPAFDLGGELNGREVGREQQQCLADVCGRSVQSVEFLAGEGPPGERLEGQVRGLGEALLEALYVVDDPGAVLLGLLELAELDVGQRPVGVDGLDVPEVLQGQGLVLRGQLVVPLAHRPVALLLELLSLRALLLSLDPPLLEVRLQGKEVGVVARQDRLLLRLLLVLAGSEVLPLGVVGARLFPKHGLRLFPHVPFVLAVRVLQLPLLVLLHHDLELGLPRLGVLCGPSAPQALLVEDPVLPVAVPAEADEPLDALALPAHPQSLLLLALDLLLAPLDPLALGLAPELELVKLLGSHLVVGQLLDLFAGELDLGQPGLQLLLVHPVHIQVLEQPGLINLPMTGPTSLTWILLVTLFIYGFFTRYAPYQGPLQALHPRAQLNSLFVSVALSFRASLLKRYGWSSLVFGLFIVSACNLLLPLTQGFWNKAFRNSFSEQIRLDISTVQSSHHAAAACVVAFTATAGRASYLELSLLAILLTFLYPLNLEIGRILGVSDLGGAASVHCFGAVAGMAFLQAFKPKFSSNSPYQSSSPLSAFQGLVAILLLFVLFPSFNSNDSKGFASYLAHTNTFLALLGAAVTALSFSLAIKEKISLSLMHVGVMAGGVGSASIAPLAQWPAAAFAAGILCALPALSLTQIVGKYDYLKEDSLFVMQSHLVPGAAGMFLSVPLILAIGAFRGSINSELLLLLGQDARTQAASQVMGLLVALGLGGACGGIAGLVSRWSSGQAYEERVSGGLGQDQPRLVFNDRLQWHMDHIRESA